VLTDALRLSRAEAAHLRHLAVAAALDPAAAAFHHGPQTARDGVRLAAALGRPAPAEWAARTEAARPLPVPAADLAPLSGAALGAGLRRAQAAWIASGFAAPRQALIAAALETAAGKA